ncbi:zinc-ribbon domain-containing protein [Leisingera thetidis]|uniref:zinc-ribbon domain-containing protein n=1 Tax=Leisingera thetidis TaxID=2930199 RepID=UPI0021F7F9D3|nr:zinc-ribbon domain-containing protein [Leisingera thetidis]
MRLTCPNCAAQYEVPEDVIPDEGRDVQCSNCGQTWFQAAAGAAAAEAAAEDIPAAAAFEDTSAAAGDDAPDQEIAAGTPEDAADAAAQDGPEPAEAGQDADGRSDAGAGDGAEYGAGDEAEDGAGEDADEPEPQTGAAEDDAAAAPPQRQRGLDPALSDILREEAEREASLRAAEGQSLETQPGLGLEEATAPEDEAARRSRQARDRMARIRGEDPRQLAAAETGSRKELLPDIEEINSTLRSAGSAAPAPQTASEEPPLRRRSSFARGFSLSLIAALVMVMVYDNAPLIAEKLPQADPALSSYVGWVDQARLWLDGQVKSLTSVQ